MHPEAVASLSTSHNLLAFSGGIDSTALFFLLLERSIPFDLAIVDYHRRPESEQEVAYAKELARLYGKKLHQADAYLEEANFEALARKFRYDFFKELCRTHHYTHLITAHQLNDATEWLFMQLAKGSGLHEMIGMHPVEKRSGYTLVRPLLDLPKSALEHYLKEHNIKAYMDESNQEAKYWRNHIRQSFSDAYVETYASGIARSFHYLRQDDTLLYRPTPRADEKELTLLLCSDPHNDIRQIDQLLKERGYLLSAAQRREILRTPSLVIGPWAIERDDAFYYIAPYIRNVIEKSIKEKFRLGAVPAKIRPYLAREGITPEDIGRLKSTCYLTRNS